MELSEKQQENAQVCENNWIRRIAGVKRADKRRRDELRVEVGGKENVKTKLVKGRLKWAGHDERMGDEKLAGSPCRKWRGKGGEEDRECDGRTVLREIWKEWEENVNSSNR